MSSQPTFCAYEHCDAPVPEKRRRRHGKFCSDVHRVRQWQLEESRKRMTDERIAVVDAAVSWYRRTAGDGRHLDPPLERLYGACARLEKAQPTQPTGDPDT